MGYTIKFPLIIFSSIVLLSTLWSIPRIEAAAVSGGFDRNSTLNFNKSSIDDLSNNTKLNLNNNNASFDFNNISLTGLKNLTPARIQTFLKAKNLSLLVPSASENRLSPSPVVPDYGALYQAIAPLLASRQIGVPPPQGAAGPLPPPAAGLPIGGFPLFPGFGGALNVGGYFPIVEKAIVFFGGGILLLLFLAFLQVAVAKGGLLHGFGDNIFSGFDNFIKPVGIFNPVGVSNDVSMSASASKNINVSANADLDKIHIQAQNGIDRKF